LPLTLIAGIYGMNFQNMPELGMRYAYYVILGFMAFVGIGMLVFFYKKGWFD
jgi:magnesium transporter